MNSTGAMSQREVLRAMSGLLLGMFVAILSSTVVSTSLPVIVADLKGSQTAYTWIITATLLTTAVSTPIWGKLADLFDRKLLIQIALCIFVVASAIAGFSADIAMMIGARALQGVGAGGLMALSQIILADIVSPRERGRYNGLFGGVMALATTGGPLLGGLVTDALNWRWNFFVALPVAVVALFVLQFTLHLPRQPRRHVRIDYWGAVLIAGSISTLLAWLSLAASGQFDWVSAETAVMVVVGLIGAALAIWVESRAAEPIIPLTMFSNRTFTLAVIASGAVGAMMFGTSVFLSQYMQLARGKTPTVSGLLTIPMMLGLFGASIIAGRVISRTGTWKPFVIAGGVGTIAGSTMLGQIDETTAMWEVSVAMFVLGVGIGMLMQNLVLVVQNAMPIHQLGVATSSVAFFRTVGGTVNVSILGSLMAVWVKSSVTDSVGALPAADQAQAGQLFSSGQIPKLSELPDQFVHIIEHAYGTAIGHVFMLTIPLAVITLLAVTLLPNLPLGSKNALQQRAEAGGAADPGEIAEETALAMAGDGLEVDGDAPRESR